MQGIRNVSATDIEMAREFGYTIKLLAIARKTDEGIDVRVHPTMIPNNHQLASVDGAMNAVFVVGDAVEKPCSTALAQAPSPPRARWWATSWLLPSPIAKGGAPLPEQEPFGRNIHPPIEDLKTRYYVRLTVEDRLGTLAACTNAFADCGISDFAHAARPKRRRRDLHAHLCHA